MIVGKTFNFNFPLYEVNLQSGKSVTEARYRFDILSDSQAPFSDFCSQTTSVDSILDSPVLQSPKNMQLENDMLLAQILQNELENEDAETDTILKNRVHETNKENETHANLSCKCTCC